MSNVGNLGAARPMSRSTRAAVMARLIDPYGDLDAEPDERHRRVATLAGIVGGAISALVVIVVLGANVAIPRVEEHLRRDVERAVLVDDPTVRATVSGRTVHLIGTVGSAAARDRLARRVGLRWGVGEVDISRLRVRSS